jgi:NitT/TauT family transport system ATP-binding protein
LLITHRIDDALEMADRALVLSAPAKVALEVRIGGEARSNPRGIADLHAQIASALGAEAQAER